MLKFESSQLYFTGIVGTGGIGSGKFFKLNGNQTLGREESRSGHLLDIKDYCKQHIILHYIKVLLGSSFSVLPIGKLGDDETGKALYNEMRSTGFIMDRVETIPNVPTLFSFCFYYPDGSGGNMTTDNSASSFVNSAFIEKAGSDIKNLGPKGIILAVPEVPMQARQTLLENGKKNGLFCAASFTSGEIPDAIQSGVFSYIDLLAINYDEASAIAGLTLYDSDIPNVVHSAIEKLKPFNESIHVSVTAGKKGSWCWDGQNLKHYPAISTNVVSTAGAGDAFFSGLLIGTSLGLHLFESQQIGSVIAGLSVTSPHTINREIDRCALSEFVRTTNSGLSEKILKLLEDK